MYVLPIETIDSHVLRGHARYGKCTIVSSLIMLFIFVRTTIMLKQLTVVYYEVMQGMEHVPLCQYYVVINNCPADD